MTMQPSPLMGASTRVALAAYMHDLGKFAERARLAVGQESLDAHKTHYCPWQATDSSGRNGYHSHVHAAYTALAFDLIEKHAPELIHGDMAPFVNRAQLQANAGQGMETDSLVNAAAAHHKPETFLQWVIATADRVASGFEREAFDAYNVAKDENTETNTGRNHYQARMLSLLEQIKLDGNRPPTSVQGLKYRYPLQVFSPQSIFPLPRTQCEPSQDGPAQKE